MDGRLVVVVADDDASTRSLFQRVLESDGYTVLLASNGRMALELVRSTPVAVMLLDFHMPELNGLEVLAQVRADPSLRALRVILVSGSTTETERMRGLESGADDVLVKPVSIDELSARVQALIQRTRDD